MVKAFDDYCMPRKCIVYHIFKFWSRNQLKEAAFDQYVTELKKLAQSCEFTISKDEMVRDKVLFRISDSSVQEKLLQKDLDLEGVVAMCRAPEVSKKHAKILRKKVGVEVIKKRSDRHQSRKNFNRDAIKSNDYVRCNKCTTKHKEDKCPAFGLKCN